MLNVTIGFTERQLKDIAMSGYPLYLRDIAQYALLQLAIKECDEFLLDWLTIWPNNIKYRQEAQKHLEVVKAVREDAAQILAEMMVDEMKPFLDKKIVEMKIYMLTCSGNSFRETDYQIQCYR